MASLTLTLADLPQVKAVIDKLIADRALLRAALVGLVDGDGRPALEQIELGLRMMPGPAEDTARALDAVHALLATLDEEPR